jgi:hypothetical protein
LLLLSFAVPTLCFVDTEDAPCFLVTDPDPDPDPGPEDALRRRGGRRIKTKYTPPRQPVFAVRGFTNERTNGGAV